MNKIAVFCDKAVRALLYALVVALPIFFLPWTFEALEFNKQTLLVVLTLAAVLAWLGKMIASKQIVLRRSFLNLLVLLYAVIYILATIFSVDRFRSFVGASGVEMDGLITVLCFVLLYFVIINNLREIKQVKNLIYSFLAGAGLLAFFALLGLWGVLPARFLPSQAANTVGTVSALGIFLSAVFILTSSLLLRTGTESGAARKQLVGKILLVVLAGLTLFLLVVIDNWMVWASFAPALALLLAFTIVRAGAIKNLGWLALPMAALAVTILLFFIRTPIQFNIPAEIMPSFSASSQITKQTLQEVPLLGSGPATFSIDYGKYKPEGVNQTPLWNVKFDRSAVSVLTVLATAGLFGVIAWLFFVVFLIIQALSNLLKEKNNSLWLSQLGIASAWFLLLVAKFMYSSDLTLEFVFWVLTALLVVLTSHKLWEINLANSPRASLILSFILTLSVIFAISTFYLVGQRYAANVRFTQALESAGKEENLDKTLELLNKATLLDRWNDVYVRNLAQTLLAKINVELGTKPSEEGARKIQSLIATDINIGKQATVLGPNNSADWATVASIYQAIMSIIPGADQWAVTSWQKATELEPSNPFFYTELGKVYESVADLAAPDLGSKDEKTKNDAQSKINENLAKAEEQLNKAIALKSDYAPAHFELALVYGRQGKISEAISKMENIKANLPDDVGVAFQLGLLYAQNKEKDKAIAELERAVQLAPQFANARWYLAALYEDAGKNDLAIQQLEEILKTNPDNDTVKQKIESLKNPTANQPSPLPEPIPEAAPAE